MSADLKIVGSPDNDEEAVRRLLGEMARQPASDVPLALEARGIATIEGAMRHEQGRRARTYGLVGGIAIAAGVAFAFFGSGSDVDAVAEVAAAHGAVELKQDGVWTNLERGAMLSEGTSVRTGHRSGAEFAMKSDVTVALRQSSELSWLDSAAKSVQLGRGSASFEVETLPKGEFFTVAAGRTTITVHGTQFSVTLQEEAAAPCVVVTEGLVEVKNPDSKVWVSAGQSTGCGLGEESESDVNQPDPAVEQDEPRPSKRVARRVQRPKTEESAPSLEEQNRLFQSALVAEQSGDLKTARTRLDLFLSKYPDSPLASQARAQRASLNSRK